MNINMRLHKEPFNYIKNGTKRYELRVYDEKRKKIKLGDIITFESRETGEKINAKVIGILRYNTFKELIEDIDISLLWDKKYTKDDLIKELSKFYSEDEKKLGVIGIKFELVV